MARGIRTLALRMKEHNQRSTELAHWLKDHPLVEQVYHPALPDNQDHPIWKRDFSGAGSLFAFRLADAPRSAIAAMLDHMSLFAMGYSWGGFESLCIPFDPRRARTAAPFTAPGNMFRIHVGFEGMDDLKADLAAGLERYEAARG
jgi:cystathionine beta-lyase